MTVVSGDVSPATPQERAVLGMEELLAGVRLACQMRVFGDVEVLTAEERHVVVRKNLNASQIRHFALNPRVKQMVLALDKPSVTDQRSDLLRIWEAMGVQNGSCRAMLSVLKKLPAVLRDGDFSVVTTMMDDLLIQVEKASEAKPPLGAAVDVGTTTIVAYIVDLATGAIEATSSSLNPQSVHGADVIARIEYGRDAENGIGTLQREVIGTINLLVSGALDEMGASIGQLYEMTVVGNTAMHHLLLGIDPRYIAEAPYIPVVSQALTLYGHDVGIKMAPGGQVFVLPVVAGFVGADTVGVMTASDITSGGATLAVDIGTNGEIALWSGERLLCASTAAGPAFEGAKISQGMYASPGAISRVDLVDGDLEVATIGDEPARGICGSALFDLIAVLLEVGAMDIQGRLVVDTSELPEKIASRMSGEGNKRRVLLASGDEAEGDAIYLTQPDIREIQLAKGALRAGMEVLLEEACLTSADLDAVLLAGAFGNHIRPESALAMGLLPDVPLETIRAVGNAAGAGAVMTLCSIDERSKSCKFAERTEHIELATSMSFNTKFMETMLFA